MVLWVLEVPAAILFLFLAVNPVLNLSLDPQKLTDFASWMPVATLSMSYVIPKLSFVDLAISPGESAPAVLNILEVLALEFVAIWCLPPSLALPFAVEELPLVQAPVLPVISARAVEFAIDKHAGVSISIGESLEAEPVLDVVAQVALIVEPVLGEDDGCAGLFSGVEVADVLGVVVVNVGAEAVGFAGSPLPLIADEVFGGAGVAGKDLDGSLAVAHAFFEMAQVYVLVGHVLEAEAVLLALRRQLRFPLSKVQHPAVVPDHILAPVQLVVHSVLELSRNHLLMLPLHLNPEQLEYLWP